MPRLKSPAHWRRQAEELRDQAGRVGDAGVMAELLDIANRYEVLAMRSEELGGWEEET